MRLENERWLDIASKGRGKSQDKKIIKKRKKVETS